MNMLVDLIPTSIEVGGLSLGIKSDFRISILFELLMQDSSVPDSQKLFEAFSLYFTPAALKKIKAGNLEREAAEALLFFYTCGKPRERDNDDSETETISKRSQSIYSFEHDDTYIYSAFMSQYHIDLQDTDFLHWWKFKALFNALDESCLMSRIMSYRAMEITQDMPDAQKKFYRKMKRVYSLPDLRTEAEKEQAFSESLLL